MSAHSQARRDLGASGDALINYLMSLCCNGRHAHAVLEGAPQGGNETHLARVWPWQLRNVAGVACAARPYTREHQQLHANTQQGLARRACGPPARPSFQGECRALLHGRSATGRTDTIGLPLFVGTMPVSVVRDTRAAMRTVGVLLWSRARAVCLVCQRRADGSQ